MRQTKASFCLTKARATVGEEKKGEKKRKKRKKKEKKKRKKRKKKEKKKKTKIKVCFVLKSWVF